MSSSEWRRRADQVIAQVIAQHGNAPADRDSFVRAIDGAYPFGERKYTPYKHWLAARKATLDTLWPPVNAIDRDCPVCGAKPRSPCVSLDGSATMFEVLYGSQTFHEGRTP